jgi:hypothetical protein
VEYKKKHMKSSLVVVNTGRLSANSAEPGSAEARCVSGEYGTMCAQVGCVMMCKLLTVMHSCIGWRP